MSAGSPTTDRFWAWDDSTRTTGHFVPRVIRIENYHFDAREWGLARQSHRLRERKRPLKRVGGAHNESIRVFSTHRPQTDYAAVRVLESLPPKAFEILRIPGSKPKKGKKKDEEKKDDDDDDDWDWYCLWCQRTPAEAGPSCSTECFREFYATYLDGVEESLVEIRGTQDGPREVDMGLGVFAKPGVTIRPNTYLGVYVGELLPDRAEQAGVSRYNFALTERGDVLIDSARVGNWTRFVNSHCLPNVEAASSQIGQVMFIVLRAIKKIGPGEELFIKYGRDYFEYSGTLCRCSAQPEPHLPPKESWYKGKEINLDEYI